MESNVFKFQGSNMTVWAKGPNIDMSKSFRPNLVSFSTTNMSRHLEKENYTGSVISQRSIYGRETSPTASIRSNLQPTNFHQPFYQSGFSQRSVSHGRAGSPVSMRSIGSSVSTATDIAQAISSGQFNTNECKMIKQALYSRRKHDFWKKAEKRRKRLYLKKIQIRSKDGSGEPWSSSSSSSDDCASTRTGYSRRYDKSYKENVPRNINNIYAQSENIFRNDDTNSCGGYTRTEPLNPDHRNPANTLPYQRQPQALSNMFFSQSNSMPNKNTLYFQNDSLNPPKNPFQMNRPNQGNMFFTQRNTLNSSIFSTKSIQNMTMISQKDRFRSGFQFPSQKFNKSSVLHEEQEKVRVQQCSKKEYASKRIFLADHVEEDSDENNDIFLATTVKPKPVTKDNSDTRRKRKVENLGDTPTSANKKTKITKTNNDKTKTQAQKNINNENNDFEFAKPHLPVRKSAPAKPREKLISKSSNAPEFVFDPQENESIDIQPLEAASPKPQEKPGHDDGSENTQMTTSDVSMRPSFMKRKLFTQTLDVTVRKNNSCDSLATDSPQSNIYSAMSREKHRTRKLTTGQSLLQRDVQDNNNLLDLIQKIVPPSQVNYKNNMAKSFNARISGSKPGDSDDKWDITSIISKGNNDSVSETYTDDEIFKVAHDEKNGKLQEKPATKQTNPVQHKAAAKKSNDNIVKISKVILHKMELPAAPEIQTLVKGRPVKKVCLSRSRIDSFWNTDVESDCDRAATPRAPTPLRLQTLRDHPTSSMHITTEIRPTKLSNKIAKTRTNQSSHVDEVNTPLAKVLKKQTSKNLEASEPEVMKKSNDTTPLRKRGRPRKATPTINLQPKKEINLSTTSETIKNPLNRKGPPSNKATLTDSTAKKKLNSEKKPGQDNNNMIKSAAGIPKISNRRQINSQLTGTSTQLEDIPKSRRRAGKNSPVQKQTEQENDVTCKVLRSRAVDLSSSFNSDQFDLTKFRTRSSRTPSKRISFNKSKNISISNKTRGRASKA